MFDLTPYLFLAVSLREGRKDGKTGGIDIDTDQVDFNTYGGFFICIVCYARVLTSLLTNRKCQLLCELKHLFARRPMFLKK
jgi:hypothetical protein